MKCRILLNSWAALCVATIGISSSNAWSQTSDDIFSQESPLEFTLSATQGSFNDLFGKRAEPNKPVPPEIDNFSIRGQVTYVGAQGETVRVPTEIKLRGNTSQSVDECPFPKLKLEFKNNDTIGTIFQGHEEIGIGTHCNLEPGASQKFKRAWGGKSPHREALLYQILQELRIPSFHARRAYANYVDTNGTLIAYKAPAFFLEDMESIEKRFGGREIRGSDVNPSRRKQGPKEPRYIFNSVSQSPGIDMLDVTRILFFQNLIRNNDFHLRIVPGDDTRALWNMKAMELSSGKWMVFPYDFDLSGMVRGSESDRKTADLQQRLPISARSQVAAEFEYHKKALYQIAGALKQADPEGYRLFKRRLDRFYSDLPSLASQ